MKKVVSFSGGRTSAYLCKVMIDTYGKENVDFIYMDTGAEHQKTYDFIKNVNREFGLELICLRGDFGLPLGKGVGYSVVDINSLKPDLIPYKEMMTKYGTPYVGGMFCTDRMKLKPFQKYCNDTYGKKNHETWLGIRADELTRVFGVKLYKRMLELGYENERLISMYSMGIERLSAELVQPQEDDIFHGILKRRGSGLRYMAEITDFDKQDVLDWWAKMPFDLGIDEWLGNCVFCPKKSNLKLAAAQRDEPESYVDWLGSMSNQEVRLVDTRTIAYMKSKGIKHYKPALNPSAKVRLKIKEYNDNLFTIKNKKWEVYGKSASAIMYRGNQSLESLIATFDGSTGKEIKSRIRGSKMVDTNSCSESCEVFSTD